MRNFLFSAFVVILTIPTIMLGGGGDKIDSGRRQISTALTAEQSTAIDGGLIDTTQIPIPSMVNTIQPFVVVFVDFADSRVPSTGLPPQDTVELNQVNINAVGSFGYFRSDPDSPFVKKIRKYTYEDYWDQFFSIGEWVGTRNPDYQSHEGYIPNDGADPYKLTLYGSVREYWNEVSYGNMQVQPFQTRSGSADKAHTGIVNRVDVIGGKNYIRWIKLPNNRNHYEWINNTTEGKHIIDSTISRLRYLHSLSTSDPDYIEFNIDTYGGKVGIVGAGGFGGGKLGGAALGIGAKYYMYSEKTLSADDRGTLLQPLLGHVHELGHLIGFDHYQGGAYEVMHWGGLRPIYHNCPPHLNPWAKLLASWIPATNVIRVRTDSVLSLPPIHNNPTIALITVYGDAGRYNLYEHSEYFIVENRQRAEFNRFTAGEAVPQDFNGGALIWHYSSSNRFNISGCVEQKLGLKVSGYPNIRYDPGNPAHFYPYHGTDLNQTSDPNSNSVPNLITGISLNSFSVSGSLVNFNVNYQLGSPPSYSIFQVSGVPPQSTNWSGNVYISSYPKFSNVIISPGTTIDLESYSSPTFTNLSAIGSDLEPIRFQGPGYNTYRNNGWYGCTLRPSQTSPQSVIKNCIFDGYSSYGLYLDFRQANGVKAPYFHKNQFLVRSRDIISEASSEPNAIPLDISGFDDNSYGIIDIYGRWKLDSATTFSLLNGSIMRLVKDAGETDSTVLTIYPNHSLFSNGKIGMYSGSKINFQPNSILKASANGIIDISPNTILNGYGRIIIGSGGTLNIISNANVVLPEGIKLDFETGHSSTWGSNTKLNISDSVKIIETTFTVGSTGTLIVNPTAKLLFTYNGSLAINGRISAKGTSSKRITFTSNSANPYPGEWPGIICNGGGPDTLTYCDIKYAETGLNLTNTAANSYLANSTIENCSYFGMFVGNTGTSNTALKIYKSEIKNNDMRSIQINNAKVLLSYSKIENNQRQIVGSPNVYVCNGGKLYIDSTRIQNNIGRGIDVSGLNSRASLSIDGIKRGYNTLTQNGLGELYVHNSATAYLGNTVQIPYCRCDETYAINSIVPDCPPGCYIAYRTETRGGWNNVYNNYTFPGKLIDNATTVIVYAQYTYWGTHQTGEFIGPVDYSNQLATPAFTPSKTTFNPPGSELFAISLERQRFIEWLLKLKKDIELNREGAIDALHNLAQFIGPGGEFQDALEVLWENYLSGIETSLLPAKIKIAASALRLQSKIDTDRFDEAIELADQVLNRFGSNQDVWLYCNTRKIFASVGKGDKAGAWMIYNAIKEQAKTIDSTSIKALDDYLKLTAGENHGRAASGKQYGFNPDNSAEVTPKEFLLSQNYPNPFNPSTIVNYQLPIDNWVTVKVYNILGEEIATLADGFETAGYKSVTFDGSNLSSGIYFVRMNAGLSPSAGQAFSDVQKIILMK